MAKPSKKGAKSEVAVAAEAKRKKEILDQVAQSNLPTKTILKELGISRSTYYSWLKRYEEEGDEGLLDSRSLPKAEEEVREVAPSVEEAEPQVTEVEPEAEVVERTPPEPEVELVAEEEPPPPAPEKPTVPPEEPVVAPIVEEKPEDRQEVVMPKETPPFAGGEKKKGIGIYAFVAILLLVLGLLFSVSLSHYNTFQLRLTDDTLTLWRGKFAARGFRLVESFEPLEVVASDVSALTSSTFAGEEEVKSAIYGFLIDQLNTELARGDEADQGKIALLLAKAEGMVGADAKGSINLANIRFDLAEKRVAIAEMELKKAYEKALPAFEEAARLGLGDSAVLEAKIEAMQETLRGLPEEAAAEEAPAAEAEPTVAPETTPEESVTAAAPEETAGETESATAHEAAGEEAGTAPAPEETPKEAESSRADETLGKGAETSAAPPEATPEVTETNVAPADQETSSEAVGQEKKPNESTGFMEWLRSKKEK